MDMDLQFPADAQEARVRSRRNISDTERWVSVAAGTLMAAYGVSRRRGNGWLLATHGGTPREAWCDRTLPHLRLHRCEHGGNRRRHAARARWPRWRHDRREDHDQSSDRRPLSILAQPRKPSPIHAPPRIGRSRSRKRCRVGGQRPPQTEWWSGTPKSSTRCQTR